MDYSQLSYAEMQSIASDLASASTSLSNLHEEIKASLNQVGESGTAWSGTAASESKITFDRFSEKFPDFIKAIDDCSRYLRSVVENYQAVDRATTGQ